jgi:ubiquinone/menaquinone biosynthesis C-methylase UbiE
LGYFSDISRRNHIDITSLEVTRHPGAADVDQLLIYDGVTMPFKDGAFYTSIAMYVLHHTPDRTLVLNEMKRVTKERIILVEELYRGLLGKIRLVLLDVWVNFRLRQKSKIRWHSYFTKERFVAEVESTDWKITKLEATKRLGFDEVLCIVSRRWNG